MLSVMLGAAFLARQFWGYVADRIGGLKTLIWSSLAQALALSGLLVTQDETRADGDLRRPSAFGPRGSACRPM